MATLYLATMRKGGVLLIESNETSSGVARSFGTRVELENIELERSFESVGCAIDTIASALRGDLNEGANIELEFGLKVTEGGKLAVSSGTRGANFKVKFSWGRA